MISEWLLANLYVFFLCVCFARFAIRRRTESELWALCERMCGRQRCLGSANVVSKWRSCWYDDTATKSYIGVKVSVLVAMICAIVIFATVTWAVSVSLGVSLHSHLTHAVIDCNIICHCRQTHIHIHVRVHIQHHLAYNSD